MIDWITAVIPCHHPNLLFGGRILSISPEGERQWETKKRLAVKGSYDSNLYIRTRDTECSDKPAGRIAGSLIELTGNPTKFLQGHNIFGTDNLTGLVAETMHVLTNQLGLEPTSEDIADWWKGNYSLSRVDINYSYELGSQKDVLAWIRAAESTAHLNHRGKGMLTAGTLYFGKHSERWALKFYSKGAEIKAKGHELPLELQETSLPQWADNKLRVELVIRGKELKRIELDKASFWGDNTPKELHQKHLSGLNMSDQYTLPAEVIEGLSPRIVLAYQSWKEGHDLRAMLPKNTFYRYRKELLPHGIDISVKQHRDTSMDNVVPLVRVLEAVPAEIPEWAIGTPLFFEPRNTLSLAKK